MKGSDSPLTKDKERIHGIIGSRDVVPKQVIGAQFESSSQKSAQVLCVPLDIYLPFGVHALGRESFKTARVVDVPKCLTLQGE